MSDQVSDSVSEHNVRIIDVRCRNMSVGGITRSNVFFGFLSAAFFFSHACALMNWNTLSALEAVLEALSQ